MAHQIACRNESSPDASIAAGQITRARPRCASRPWPCSCASCVAYGGLAGADAGQSARPRQRLPTASRARCRRCLPACVPPAPKVTEQNSGCRTYRRAAQRAPAWLPTSAVFGREKFQAQGNVRVPDMMLAPTVLEAACPARGRSVQPACVAHIKNSRLPSPPAIGESNHAVTASPRSGAGSHAARLHDGVQGNGSSTMPPLPTCAGLQLELRLDQRQQGAARLQQGHHGGQHQRLRDE